MTEKVAQVGSNRLLHSDKKFFKMKKNEKTTKQPNAFSRLCKFR